MRRADQHGPALGPQPARHTRRSHSALRTLAATDRSRRARDQRHAGHDEYRGGHQRRRAAWAKLKAELRRIAARTAEALHQALRPALDTITAQDAAGFFRHAGYSRPN